MLSVIVNVNDITRYSSLATINNEQKMMADENKSDLCDETVLYILTQFKLYFVKYMRLHSMKTDNSVLYRASSF